MSSVDTMTKCELAESCFLLAGHAGRCLFRDEVNARCKSPVVVKKAFKMQPCYAACAVGQRHMDECIMPLERVRNVKTPLPVLADTLDIVHDDGTVDYHADRVRAEVDPGVDPSTLGQLKTDAFKDVCVALERLPDDEAKASVLRAVAILFQLELRLG